MSCAIVLLEVRMAMSVDLFAVVLLKFPVLSKTVLLIILVVSSSIKIVLALIFNPGKLRQTFTTPIYYLLESLTLSSSLSLDLISK